MVAKVQLGVMGEKIIIGDKVCLCEQFQGLELAIISASDKKVH